MLKTKTFFCNQCVRGLAIGIAAFLLIRPAILHFEYSFDDYNVRKGSDFPGPDGGDGANAKEGRNPEQVAFTYPAVAGALKRLPGDPGGRAFAKAMGCGKGVGTINSWKTTISCMQTRIFSGFFLL